MDNYFI
jgi:hypothetical protein